MIAESSLDQRARMLPRPFKLTRFFSYASLIGLVAVTACLLWAYRTITVHHLLEHESRANANLTHAFANTVWSRYRGYVLGAAGRTRAELKADPALAAIHAEVLEKMRGLHILKVKIYSRDGLTVFSTDESQIGDNKSANPGFRAALTGDVISEIVYRDKFDAFEGTLSKRNLISSYVPIRATPTAAVEGVFEVYSDVTELLKQQTRAQWQVAAMVLSLLVALYLFLLVVVRKADRIIARQVREQEAKENAVRHQAYHDVLTGLPNRASFAEQLNQSITLAARHGHTSALMFVDLDRFKIVNDSLGHEAGDTLLKIASGRIHSCLRGSDQLFRMGGDEFTIILPVISAPGEAASVAQRILEAVASPVSIREHELIIGATIGIAVYPGDGFSAEALLRNADAAMYSAKGTGRGTFAFYHTAMNRRALHRLQLESALQKAYREGEFTLYYQPRLDAATRRVVALEALLRWAPPGREVALPDEFICALEETGMIVLVGEWVLRSACAEVCRWQAQGSEPLRVSINISSVQFQSAAFVAMVARVLAETGVTPRLIELELSDSVLVNNPDQARATVTALKELGVRISLDDFGVGNSSLNYLRHFAVDYIKLDRTFVATIATSPRDRAVATAISELARALDITVLAKGVETEAQAEFFAGVHRAELQGYLFCKPLPVDRLERFLERGDARENISA